MDRKKIIFSFLYFFVFCILASAQDSEDLKYKITPTINKESPSGVYIPKDLEECFKELKTMLQPSLVAEMKAKPEKEMIGYHHGLGMWIRNNWGLWSDSRLKKYFNNLGIRHPDDMSSIILNSFWRHLHNQLLELDRQIKYYQEYWENVKKQK
ncbi:MAG: DUF6794 domain-containing protein [Candidatus Omnitrophota bacterium]